MNEEREFWFLHSTVGIRSPIVIDVDQIRLTLGITCPRHRRLLKNKLGWFGRWLPDKEWQVDERGREVLVSVKK